MLKPLEPERITALLSADKYAGCGQIHSAKRQLGENEDLRSGVVTLLEVFPSTFEARLHCDIHDDNIWWIYFRVR